MSHPKRDLYKRKLRKTLSSADDESFCRLMWAIDNLQSGRPNIASRHLRFPTEAATSDMTSDFAIRKWELETLLTLLFTTPKRRRRDGMNRMLDCSRFEIGHLLAHQLRELEDAEAGVYLNRTDVLNEMHRIAHRQFPWQRGFFNVVEFYHYSYIYCQGRCADYFHATYGLTISDFVHIGLALYAFACKEWSVSRDLLRPLSLDESSVCKALTMLSRPIDEMRAEASKMLSDARTRHRSPLPTAYQPSVLRQFPIIALDSNSEVVCAPLPKLIMVRVTSGLYYDLVIGKEQILSDANNRFEQYVADLLTKLMPRFQVTRSHKYRYRGNSVDTPDVLVSDFNNEVVAIECKAARLTFDAQFSDDPFSLAERQYNQIVKGVAQLWRYFSRLRLGVIPDKQAGPDIHGMVVTLDPWLDLSRPLQEKVLDAATEQLEQDTEVIEADRRKVVFCSLPELEHALLTSNEDAFLHLLSISRQDRFVGWQLSGVHQKIETRLDKPKEYPFYLGDVLPWWKRNWRHPRQVISS